MNLDVFELASNLVMSIIGKESEMKVDFSVCNNGLRENQKKNNKFGYWSDSKIKNVITNFFFEKAISYAKFYYEVQKRHFPFRCVAHLFNDLGKVFCKNPFANMAFNGPSSGWQRDCKPQLTEK